MTEPFTLRLLTAPPSPESFTGEFTREQILEFEVNDLRAKLRAMEDSPIARGVVLETFTKEEDGDLWAVLSMGAGQACERRLGDWAKGVTPGMGVRCASKGIVPLAFYPLPPGAGRVVTVKRLHDGMVEYGGLGHHSETAACGIPCRINDRVHLDPSNSVVVRNFGPETTSERSYTRDSGITWDDIGGLEEAKRQLREVIEDPVIHAEIYRRYGKGRCKGVALSGPAGCGKSRLIKACATALAKLHGKSAKASGLIAVKGPELLHGLVGSSEANVRALFASARQHFADHGYPALIMLDEADSLLGKRGATRWEGMERTIVPMFLSEMDGLEESGALVILSTNRPEMIDEAIMRDERMDLAIHVGRPSEADCETIFGLHLRGRPAPAGLASLAAAELFSQRHVLGMLPGEKGAGPKRVTLSSVVSGAMVKGIVERATQRALRRALAGADDGITVHDVVGAVEGKLAELKAGKGA